MTAGTLRPPEVTITGDTTTPQGRSVAVDIRPPSGSYAITIDTKSGDGIAAITVNQQSVPQAAAGSPTSIRVVAFSPAGTIPLKVTVPAGATVELAMGAYTRGLERSPAGQLQPRPSSLTTAVHEVPDAILVTSVVRLPD